MQGCAHACASVCKRVQACAGVCRRVQACASVCRSVHTLVQACARVCRRVQACAGVCTECSGRVQGVCCTVYVCTCSEHACSGRSGRVHGVSKARARSVQACTSDQSCAPMPTSFAVVGKPTCAGRWAGGHARMKRMKPPISMCLVVVARCRDRV